MKAGLIIAFAVLCVPCMAQKKPIAGEIPFVEYLVESGMPGDAVAYLNESGFAQSDTLNFLSGWACYNAKLLPQAKESFGQVPMSSPFGEKSLFFGTVVDAHLGLYDDCMRRLESYKGPRQELKNYAAAGICLLKQDREGYLAFRPGFDSDNYLFSEGARTFDEAFSKGIRTRKPWAGALMSAVLPGLGQAYGGRASEAAWTFIAFGASTAFFLENLFRFGKDNWRTITFGITSSLIYLGNIGTAYFGVKLHNIQLLDAQKTAILYSVHIPVRNSFR